MNPDPSKHYVLGFSGGKDSVATWLHLTRELSLPNVTCTFADTAHESPVTYQYLQELEYNHGCPIVRITPTLEDMRGELKPENIAERLGIEADDPEFWHHPLTMENLAILKRRFPSSMVRFCTTHLKLHPQRRWLHENFPDLSSVVRVSGVRAQESPARAQKQEWAFDEFMGCDLWLPIHQWTHNEVFDCHKRYGIPPNPLYLQGFGRVGCFPCIMARKKELAAMADRHPEAFDSLKAMEERAAKAIGKPKMSFFSTGKAPERFASNVCENSGKRFPDAEDVRRWASGAEPVREFTLPLFEEDHTEDAHCCTSQYGLCE